MEILAFRTYSSDQAIQLIALALFYFHEHTTYREKEPYVEGFKRAFLDLLAYITRRLSS
jgi:hypothetical protein